jgi:prepilin-type N-terminal cleavage/methylation domain-containing protein
MRLNRGRPRADGGFTLIELLITLVIMGVITVPLGNFMLAYFKNVSQTTARLNESHDAQIAAAYFAQDVAGLGTRNRSTLRQSVWQGSTAGAPYSCGSGTPVLLLAADRFAGPGTATVIETAYVTNTIGGELQLQRVTCAGSSAAATTVVVAHNIDPAAPPSVTCTVTPWPWIDPFASSCTGSDRGPLGNWVPTAVSMSLSIRTVGDTGSAYAVTLTGVRRQT